jgi:hypothetical protein
MGWVVVALTVNMEGGLDEDRKVVSRCLLMVIVLKRRGVCRMDW